MRIEELVELVEAIPAEDRDLSLEEFSQRWGEPVPRIVEALELSRAAHRVQELVQVEQMEQLASEPPPEMRARMDAMRAPE